MFNALCNTTSDINEHLPALRDLASECSHVTEMGVRYIVSTWAFVEGLKGGKLISIDYKHPKLYGGDIEKVITECKNKSIDFTFIEASTLSIEIEPTELLFIDTDHTYKQLSQELKLHADKATKYIALHDTVSCREELIPAVDEFLAAHPEWKIKHHYTHNNGLIVLQRC